MIPLWAALAVVVGGSLLMATAGSAAAACSCGVPVGRASLVAIVSIGALLALTATLPLPRGRRPAGMQPLARRAVVEAAWLDLPTTVAVVARTARDAGPGAGRVGHLWRTALVVPLLIASRQTPP